MGTSSTGTEPGVLEAILLFYPSAVAAGAVARRCDIQEAVGGGSQVQHLGGGVARRRASVTTKRRRRLGSAALVWSSTNWLREKW